MLAWLKLLALPALLLLGFYMIDSRAEQRGKDAALVAQTLQRQLVLDAAAAVEDQLKADAIVRDQELHDQLAQIRLTDKTTLIKEIRSETRFSDPALGITDGMLDTLNQARALTGAGGPVTGGESSLSSVTLPEGPDN